MFQQYGAEFLSLALIHFVAVVMPGPDFAVTLQQSIRYGRRAGIMTALGIAVGLSIHIAYTLLGIGALIHAMPLLFNVIKLMGSLYIFYLGIQFLRSQPSTFKALNAIEQSAQTLPWRRAFLRGFFCNVTNPKATLFFVAIFSAIVSIKTPLAIKLFYGVWMCAVNAVWFILVSLLLTQSSIRARFLQFGHWFERAVGLILIVFAIRLLFYVID